MVKKFLKSKSKRMPVKKRYKIEKKVRDHNRKIKKINKTKVKSKKTKLITVPGDCPFKEKILEEAVAVRDKIKKAKEARHKEVLDLRKLKRESLLAAKRGLDKPGTTVGAVSITPTTKSGIVKLNAIDSKSDGTAKPRSLTFEDLRKRAEASGYQFEKIEQAKTQRDPSLKAFYREFQKVIEDSDVVIQVLDSRDPLGTRSSEAEEAVRSHTDKKLIVVLNKCDLIPVDNLQKWVAYLKQTMGCVVLPFKANTQKQKNRLGSVGNINTNNQASMETKKSIGVSDLMGFLGTLARGEAGGLTIGVIGMPNVGKSSLINSLKRSRACNVGAKPGITRTNQMVHLDSKLRLIDSPGVCFSKEKGEGISVETILSRVPKTTLMLQYGIQEFSTLDEFLSLISRKYGQLKKGGIHDPNAAEKKIIHDWHTGAIKFLTEPPELESTTTAAAILNSLAEPFSLDNFKPTGTSAQAHMDVDLEDNDEDSDDVDMSEEEVENEGRITRSAAKKKVTFGVNTEYYELQQKKKQLASEMASLPGKSPLGVVATKKSALKKLRKSKKKSTKKATELAQMIDDFKF